MSQCNGSWPGGSGSNPGSLVQELRAIVPNANISVNSSGGTAFSSNKNC